MLNKQVWPIEAKPVGHRSYKGSAANTLVPDTTALLQSSGEVHGLTGQGCFGNKKRTSTIYVRMFIWNMQFPYVKMHIFFPKFL